ncbi:hypothetical protein [Streptomyces sp.]|uniref:hypothetical protein n=1 Tax=Streptomyces sp. TaxID=1931 RepID=UPI002F951575
MTTRVYRLDITYPDGHDKPGWRPTNWHDKHDLNEASWITGEVKPCTVYDNGSCDWEKAREHNGPYDEGGSEYVRPDNTFKWPAERLFLGSASAYRRTKRLRELGATVTVRRSKPVTWPHEGRRS